MLAGIKTFFGAPDELRPPSIKVRNLQQGANLSYPLVLLEGSIEHVQALGLPESDCFIHVCVQDDATITYWPFSPSSGQFKVFAFLPAAGSYDIRLQVAGADLSMTFPVHYEPPSSRFQVRFYYQKCAGAEEEGFDAPDGMDNSDKAALARIQWAALMMQTAMAELLHDQGLPRQTFALEMDTHGMPHVHRLQSSFTNATAHSVSDQELHKLVDDDLQAMEFDDTAEHQYKHAVILGCSRWNAELKKAEGHTALGGKSVGIFGSCGLHAWPQQLGDLTACCLNNTRINEDRLWDDSCYRKTHWANFSTGLGAFFHELGHTLGLGHSVSGIMGRGFDDMNRIFSIYEPRPLTQTDQVAFMFPTGDGRMQLNRSVIREVSTREGAHWHKGSALRLTRSPWITAQQKRSTSGPMVAMDPTTRGPVGAGGSYDGELQSFGRCLADDEQLGAIAIVAGKYVNRMEMFTRAEVSSWSDKEFRASGTRHLFVLMEGEYIEHMDVRAGYWIDGVQLQTNKRLSRWFGGFGGKVHRLRAPGGCCLNGIFGAHCEAYVRRLSVSIAAVPAPRREVVHAVGEAPVGASTTAQCTTTSGRGAGDGDQWQFMMREASISAIAIKCDTFVEGFHVLSLLEHATQSGNQDSPSFAEQEHIFELIDGETITSMDVMSGNWVDAIRLHTNLRSSPWYGGQGGSHSVITPPSGHRICGFYGTHGNKYLGSIGACYCEMTTPATIEEASDETVAEVMEIAAAQDQEDVLSGVIVALQDGLVHTVESFTTTEGFNNVVNLVHASSGRGVEVMCYPLRAGESLIQIDVNIRPENENDPSSNRIIDGICFHSTFGCSTWFGKYSEATLEFMVPPKGSVFESLKGIRETGSVVRIDTKFQPLSARFQSRGFEPDARVFVPQRQRDVRIESVSQCGIHSAFLMKPTDSGELNDFKAWSWTQFSTNACPPRWMLPFSFFETYVEGEDKEEMLMHSFAIVAMDDGGSCSS